MKNVQSAERSKGRLSRDALYNLHEFAFDSNFIHHITTLPDLGIFMYHPPLLNLFLGTLSNLSYPAAAIQVLSYDTTFNLGDFYLSVLLYRHTEFSPPLSIPLAYLLHERKLTVTHDHFFAHIRSILPDLECAANVVIVTDAELAITTAVSKNFPQLPSYLCWNHVQQVLKL